MHLNFVNPGIDEMLGSIMEFQGEDVTAFWSEPLFHFYPQLDKDYVQSLNKAAKRDYVTAVLKNTYETPGEYGKSIREIIDEKVISYDKHWQKHETVITEAFSDAFQVDCRPLLNEMCCRVSMNPICPRFLEDSSFDIFYLNSERGALGLALHEITHFLWFHVWQQVFEDDPEEYEHPSLKWILSEMVVEIFLSDERLKVLNPYFPREQGSCIYPYFYDMMAGDRLILDRLQELHQKYDIPTFMKESYALCQTYETAIRRHIQKAEEQGI